MSVTSLALDQAVWVPAAVGAAATVAVAGIGTMTTIAVKRMSRRSDDALALRTELEARRTEIETEALVEQARDDDQDRDLSRMRATLDLAFDALERLNGQVARERQQRDEQFARHVEVSQRQFDELQAQSDRRHEFVTAEMQELRAELQGTRSRIRAHRPWDEQVAKLVRECLDGEFPDPPEL